MTVYDLLRRLCGPGWIGDNQEEKDAAFRLIADLEKMNALGTVASEQNEHVNHAFRGRANPFGKLCAECNLPEEAHHE